MKPSLIVVGAGYVGCAIARRLDGECDVTLVEPRQAFVHAPAMIRALVRPDLLDTALMPYDRLLRHGRVVRSRVTSVEARTVRLSDGTGISGDMILVSTGSAHMNFLKPQGDSIADFRLVQAEIAGRIAAARRIVIAGAGPVGIELAGEIATAHPDKQVTLVSATPGLLPGYPARLGAAVARKLRALGVTIRHGRAALSSPDHATVGPLSLDDGRIIEADLVLPATGSRPNTGVLDGLAGAQKAPDGRILPDPWLRLPGHSALFLGGDVAATADAMTIVATMRQIPFLVGAMRHVIHGRDLHGLRPYRAWGKAPILLPLGPRRGASFLPLPGPFGRLGVVGDMVTRQMKGKDLFIPKYRRIMRLGRVSPRQESC